MFLELIPFIVLIVLSCVIGFLASKKTKEASGFFLGGRSLHWFLLMMTFIGTQIGGGFILGTAEASFSQGIYGIFYSIGLSFGFLALGLGLGARIRSLELHTVADVFERYYLSKGLKKYASLLSILSLTGILIAQAVSLRKFLFSINLSNELLFIATWTAIIAYTTKGGFLAVVWTDMVQASVMIFVLVLSFAFTFCSQGAVQLQEMIAPSNEAITPTIMSYLIMPFLFMFIEQDMVQRCSSGKSRSQVTIATLGAAIILFLLAFIPVYFGLLAKTLGIEPGEGSVFMEVVRAATNPWVTTCAALSVLLAIISTASSLLLAVSSNLSQDFTTGDFSITRSRLITIGIGITALVISYTAKEIIPCLIMSYELAVDSLFVPLLAAVFLKEKVNNNRVGSYLAVGFGTAGFLLEKVTHFFAGYYFIPLLLSLIGYLVGYLIGIGRPAYRKDS